jgi:hypothetical protein
MNAKKDSTTRPSRRSRKTSSDPASQPPAALPSHVFAPEFLAHLAERDEPETAWAADTAGPWHVEPNLRQGESFEKSTRTVPTATAHPGPDGSRATPCC